MFSGSYWGGRASPYVWPAPDPLGPLMTPLSKLAELCAAVPVFRTRCGLDVSDPFASQKLLNNAHGGPKKIFYPAADTRNWKVFPAIVLFFGNRWNWETRAGGSQHYLVAEGNLMLAIFDEDHYPGDPERSTRDFATFVGQFFSQLCAYFARDDELAGVRVQQESPPHLPTLEEAESRGKNYWMASYLIDWRS